MASPLLEVENLKTYFFTKHGVVKAVDGVTFSVGEGEALGIVGESGCGKSITMMSIMRLVPEPGKIVDGKISFEGEDIRQRSEGQMRNIRGKKIAMILQDPMMSLDPVFTIGDQVAESIRLHQKVRGKGIWQKVIEALRLVKISDPETRLCQYPHEMSGGMRQRVTGAIALCCQPRLLIADEPTTSLDVTIQAQYLKLLKEIQRESGTGMIFITHDFGIVARMCDKASVMYAGKIVERAGIRELFNNPCHPYTKALMGCLPKLEVKGERLVTIEGQPPDLSKLPVGCSFAPRCPEIKKGKKADRCKEGYPMETMVNDGHYVSCWLGG